MILRLFAILMFLAAPFAQASEETVIADLSQNRVAITANFDGSEILIFGAVKRQTPPPGTGPLQVVITVTGPLEPVVVRRKERQIGIWANKDSVEIDQAPSFYSVSSTGALEEVLSSVEDLRYSVSINNLIRSVGAPMDISDSASFTEAVIRIRGDNGLYTEKTGQVKLQDETLFQTSVALPSNLTEGNYTARIFLTRDKKVLDSFETTIDVQKVGLERWIFNLAHQKPLIYGLLSLFIAISAGWLASAVFRVLRIG